MNTQDHKVAYGFLPNFKGAPVILFAGDQRALEDLATFLDRLVMAPTNVTRMLDAEPLFFSKRGIRLTLTFADPPLGMRRIASDCAEPRFEWHISKALAARFAELTRAVAHADEPSHQYLDADRDEVTVIVSKGEYDEAWLQRR
jgi:hypothetical protein